MILCCGEALIDMLPVTTTDGASAFAPHAGGAVFNTAIALGRLGARAGFFSGLSADFMGDILRKSLHDAGVDTTACATVDRPCTLAFVRLVNGQASYAFYDENSAGRMLQPGQPETVPAGVQALFFGGISLVGDPCGTAYEALARRESPRRLIVLDPNIRPGFVTDQAAYRARLDRLLALADIVKVSDEDLAWITGTQDLAAGAEALRGRGVPLVVVTRGAEGASAWSAPTGRVDVAANRVQVVDTVGAGDTFNAGLLASLQAMGMLDRGALAGLGIDALAHALGLGVAAAAVTVSRAGANSPWRHELPADRAAWLAARDTQPKGD